MFKIDVTLPSDNSVHGHYIMNRHNSDFIKGALLHFTKLHKEEITKDDIVVYKIAEEMQPELEKQKKESIDHTIDTSEPGKIKIKKIDKAPYKAGDVIKETDYVGEEARRKNKFSKAKGKKPKKAKKPRVHDHDFGDGKQVSAVKIPEDHELTKDIESTELELTGTLVSSWPYNEYGKFTGNK